MKKGLLYQEKMYKVLMKWVLLLTHTYSSDKTLDKYLPNTVQLKVDGLLQLMVSSNLSVYTVIPKLYRSGGFLSLSGF